MSICGLVITLAEEQQRRAGALSSLQQVPGLTLGEALGQRLPAVLETPDRAAFRQTWDDLLALTGVLHLDLAYVGYDEQKQPPGGKES